MRKLHTMLKPVLLGVLLAVPMLSMATPEVAPLAPAPQQPLIEQLIAHYTERGHYAERELDDAMSEEILERYLETLDPNHVYFLASDVKDFEQRFRHSLDDSLKAGELDPAYVIYRVLRERVQQRIDHARTVLAEKPDFTIEETFHFDRSDADWASSSKELNEYWRKRVKNEVLGLILADKSWEEARETLEKRYAGFERRVYQVNGEDVFELFMNAYATTLDPHTQYFSPRDSEEFEIRMSLSYEGIGASLQAQDEYVQIVRLIPGGSAEKSDKLNNNDRITAVGQGDEGEMVDVIGWRLDDVVELIRGPKESIVRLQILPAGAAPGSEEKVIALTRNEIKLEEQAAQAEVLDITEGGRTRRVGVIEIPAFYLDYRAMTMGDKDYRSTTRDVRRLIDELKADGAIDGLVVDLRNNGGGSLREAADLTGLFIDEGPVVQIRNTTGRTEVLGDNDPGVNYDGPLVVLVNRFSASASEIFAGAIQDYGRGLVVGSTTFGKGTIQNLIDLNRFTNSDSDLGQLKMTTGKFYRVTGSSTQHRGVIPDIELPSPVELSEVGESSQKSALPWDEIAPASKRIREVHVKALDVLPELREEIEKRQAGNELFQIYLQDIETSKEWRSRKEVSLNLAERTAEQKSRDKESLERINQRRTALGLEPVEDLEAAAETEEEYDLQLQESARILVDYIAELAPGMADSRLARRSDTEN
jgi:carboxyl-terminal processing protease